MDFILTPLKWLVILAMIIVISSCEKESKTEIAPGSVSLKPVATEKAGKGSKPNTAYTTYTIRKGQHSSYSSFKSLSTNSLVFEAIFDKSAIYTSIDPVNQGDINKLYGMADCGSSHQTNSARFGWRWYNNSLQVFAYVYHGGVRAAQFITTVDLDKAYRYELILGSGYYTFRLNGQEVQMPRSCSGTGVGYQLYPYFGGDEVAPHDITIKIRNL